MSRLNHHPASALGRPGFSPAPRPLEEGDADLDRVSREIRELLAEVHS